MRFAAGMLLAVLTGALSAQTVHAAWPERPIRMIVPSAAGGQPDTNSRLVATELSKLLGQQVVVDNRPGAASSIGFEAIAKAQPDGYTIGYGGFPLATNQALLVRVPYDIRTDFSPISMLGTATIVLVVHPALPVKSAKELIALA
ncbi:MAG: tripartite tricarboxylate transporter substrate binding protein, partial [Betaproteobacteria bacterium]|nr:tripartite tricarboxylate transporter substrate binding protein [Betaproteobacteria bacterium]